jgi:hypothetical protein
VSLRALNRSFNKQKPDAARAVNHIDNIREEVVSLAGPHAIRSC